MKTTKTTRTFRTCALFLLVALRATSVHAQGPAPDYSGGFLKRSTMTGDWGGSRNEMAKKGVTFDFNLFQTEVGVVEGGTNSKAEYGGRGDFILKVDTGKAGLWPGGFLQIEGEVNYGSGANSNTGALIPVNTNQLFPVPGKIGSAAIPSVQFLQFLSPHFGVLVGKLYVTSADDNEFAHGKYGKGDTQFMNLAFNFNPATLFAAPYTPIGGGLVILPNKNPEAAIFNALVFSATGTASKAGFDNFEHDNLSVSLEGRVRTHFFGKTGHQDVGYLHSNREFSSLDQRLSLDPGTQLVEKKSGSWVVFYNFDQYLYEPSKGKGFGIFGRFAISDGNPNFLHHVYSLGFGGKGVGAKRPNDSYGFGGFYIDISNPTLTTPFGSRRFLRDETGGEAYYSLAVTPWAHLSPHLQVVRGARRQTLTVPPRNIDTAVVLGLRLGLTF